MNKPQWIKRVIEDVKNTINAAERSFKTPGVIVGFTDDDNGEKMNYLIRLTDGEIGVYPKHILGQKDFHTGIKIRGRLPEPKTVAMEPDIASFIFEVLREQIKLIPRIWLKSQIRNILNGQEVNIGNDFYPWVLISPEKKKDKQLLKLLEMATAYEGLKGLARYNDYASN